MAKFEPKLFERRRVLVTIGTGTAIGLAGCLGADTDESGGGDTGEADSGGDGGDDNGGSDGTDDTEDTDEEPDLAEPTEFPEDRECAVCNMVAAEHPDWNAQLVHENEHREYFCSSGCMSAYYVAPGEFGGPDAEIGGVWVTDFETRELVDGTGAHYVRVTDPEHVDDIMMRNPTPFAQRDDAVAFVDGFDDYDEGDILALADFDMELAMLYRGKFFEEDGDMEHDHDTDDPQPTEFPEDSECAVCGMAAAKHPKWNAQVLHESDDREYFCSTGCMAAYYVDQERFGDSESDIVGVWVTEYDTTDIIDGTTAYYVLVTDPEHVDDVMNRNPTPFAEYDDAMALADEFDEYDEDDIVTIEDFDMELAELYRGKFFEEDGDMEHDGHDMDDD